MSRFTQGSSITATLDRQWEYMADSIIRQNLHLRDEEIVALIRKEGGGARDAAWVRSRRHLFVPKPNDGKP